ncbi:MAG TPA: hypothetical protein VF739_05995, partial [Ktedonobacterales bacterium]
YQVFSALWWVAVVYLLLLNIRLNIRLNVGFNAALIRRAGSRARVRRAGRGGDSFEHHHDHHLDHHPDRDHGHAASEWLARIAPWMVGANAFLLIVATLGMALTSWRSVPTLEAFQSTQLQTEGCVVNVAYATVPCLWSFYPAPSQLPERVAYLRAQQDGIFAGNYQRLVQPAPTPSAHALVRYVDAANGDVWVTTRYDINFYWSYAATGVLGYLYDQQQPGAHPLYECVTAAGRHVVSLQAQCAGGTTLRTEGWLLNQADASAGERALYACAGSSAETVSTPTSCGGGAKAVLLGYALTHEP